MYNYILSRTTRTRSEDTRYKKACIFKIHKYMNEDVHSKFLAKRSSERLNKSLEYYERFKEHQSITKHMIQREDFKMLKLFNREAKIDNYDKLEQITYSISVFGNLRKEILENEEDTVVFNKIRLDMYLALDTGNTKFISNYSHFAPIRLPVLRNIECLKWYMRYDDMEGYLKGSILGDSIECMKYLFETKNIPSGILIKALDFAYWSNKEEFVNLIEEYMLRNNIKYNKNTREFRTMLVQSQNPSLIKRNIHVLLSTPKDKIPFYVYYHSSKNKYLRRVLEYFFVRIL